MTKRRKQLKRKPTRPKLRRAEDAKAKAHKQDVVAAPRPGMIISPMVIARARSAKRKRDADFDQMRRDAAKKLFAMPDYPPTVFPGREKPPQMAMDEQPVIDTIAWSAQSLYQTAWTQGYTFLGYPYLSELAQVPEYRRMVEVIATEMTRKWIKITSVDEPDDEEELMPKAANGEPMPTGEEAADGSELPQMTALADAKKEKAKQKAARIKQLNDELIRLKVREAFQKCAEVDGFFGRAHLYIDTGKTDEREELKLPIGDGSEKSALSKAKIKKGSIVALRVVEPVWCYPSEYDSNNPLKKDWYNPQAWFVQGTLVHKSRLLLFVGREVPDMLKPAYSFGGLSVTQMAKPYVDNWLRTRQSVSDLIHAFSVMVLSTDMSVQLGADGEQLFNRIDLFNALRDNKGVFFVNKDSEDLKNIAVPLGTLDHLQAQAQEQMCSVSAIPLVKFTGISPTGLNASSEGELRVFYDHVNAYQEKFFRPNLTVIFHLAQRNLWGAVDPDLNFEFEPLWSLDEAAEAGARKTEADTDTGYINAGVLSPEEVRKKVAADPGSPYAGIDVDDVPEPPGQDGMEEGMMPPGMEEGMMPPGMEGEGADGEGGEGDEEGKPPASPGAAPLHSKPVPSKPLATKPVSSKPVGVAGPKEKEPA